MTVAMIDYGSGNLHSATKAFERAARDNAIIEEIRLTADPDVVAAADRVVLPGVGAFADCRRGLAVVSGMDAALEKAVIAKGRPFLGICVGMQLMAERGLEYQTSEGLGWIAGDMVMMKPSDPALKIPHMGWNTIDLSRNAAGKTHPLFDGIPTGPDGRHAYFVHSYHLEARKPEQVVATFDYGGTFTAMVGRDNMVGTQFHPEKSQKLGLALIANFLKWKP
ncbi:imidazole glycerol phosphate synthase subunit HisH [Breoghania sp.]|uniref:imidazole glycerol phosphate synthase subunit HisH n=1 Tax=Breoghania sp. TaxID=2065378 RepID=UPI0026054D83|nr:imidazole glycerol phosphate synthase subunit HisH [Breoghania sp.]MDJ0930374.1 imidazole glycerol phosphate synthase subunit HisH [Breoghania sp.]